MSLSLSPLVRFGTSTWTYEGWQGQVYKREYAKSTFTRECLGELRGYKRGLVDWSRWKHEAFESKLHLSMRFRDRCTH